MSVFGGFGSNGTLTNNAGSVENIFASHTNILQNGYTKHKQAGFHYGGTEVEL